jgi:hypothetical protein
MKKKSNGIIEAALREHASSKVKTVGKPKIAVGAFIGMVAAVAGLSFVNVTHGDATGRAPLSIGATAKAAGFDIGTFVVPSFSEHGTNFKKDAEHAPAPRYLTREFFDVAADAIRHNSGVSLEEAANSLDAMEDAGQGCKTTGGKQAKCIFTLEGIELDYVKEVYTATYNRYSKDRSVDLGDRVVGAVQKGDQVVVRADPHKRTFPVPAQGR